MADFDYTITDTGRGALQSFAQGERKASFMASTWLVEHPRVGPSLTALNDAFATTAETLQQRSPDLTPSGFAKLARERVAANIKPAFRVALSAVPSAEADLEKRSGPFQSPSFRDDQPPAVRVEQRQFARALPLPKLIEAVQSDPALAAAVVEGGVALSGLPADLFDRLRRDLMVGRATDILSQQRTYRTPPTADDPIGGKPDAVAARAAGEELIASFEGERTLLDSARGTLAMAITVVALMIDVSRDQAFEMLTAAA